VGELRKVTWPTRQETIRLTLMVVAICIVMALILGGIDYAFTRLVTGILLP
jgi:preprotein translocase subunit SecE